METEPCNHPAIEAWERYKKRYEQGLLEFLAYVGRGDMTAYQAASLRVAEDLGSGAIDPAFIEACWCPFPAVSHDPTNISTLILQRMFNRDQPVPTRVPDMASIHEWARVGKDEWAVAVGAPWTERPLTMTSGAHIAVVANSQAVDRFLVGAVRSFRFTHHWQSRGPIVIAMGEDAFRSKITAHLNRHDVIIEPGAADLAWALNKASENGAFVVAKDVSVYPHVIEAMLASHSVRASVIGMEHEIPEIVMQTTQTLCGNGPTLKDASLDLRYFALGED